VIAEAAHAGVARDLGVATYQHGGATRAMALWGELVAFPTGDLWLDGFVLGVVCLWTLLVSTWLGRSGVAGVGALVLLAALGTPFLLLVLAHPWFFPAPRVLIHRAAALAAVLAALAAAASYLGGRRFAGRPLRPFLAGASVLLVCAGGGYAQARIALRHWLHIDPHAADFRIQEAHVGPGARHLFLTVTREGSWRGRATWRQLVRGDGVGAAPGMPVQAWVVEVGSGALRRVQGGATRAFESIPDLRRARVQGWNGPYPLEPEAALVCRRVDADGALTWWDAATAEPVRTLPGDVRDAATLALVRRTLSAASWQRDARGKRVWMRGGVLQHEDVPAPVPAGLVPVAEPRAALRSVPGGWYGPLWTPGSAKPSPIFVDAATGREETLPKDLSWAIDASAVLSRRYALGHVWEPSGQAGRKIPRSVLVPLHGGQDRPRKNEPEIVGGVIGRELVLALRGAEGSFTLHAWDPVRGADRPIPWAGKALDGIARARVVGHAGDGRMLLALHAGRPGHVARAAWVVLAPDARSLHPITGWTAPRRSLPIALLPDDVLITLDDRRRVVRHAPGRAPEVLFPR
jgi:hypothetical protein